MILDQSNRLQTVNNNGVTYRSYSYDASGNAITDGGAQTTTYNMLNLPQSIKIGATTKASYDASGRKLQNTGKDGSGDYIDGIVYFNGAIKFVQTEAGRIAYQFGMYHYEYNLIF